jgi:hypothetical protein
MAKIKSDVREHSGPVELSQEQVRAAQRGEGKHELPEARPKPARKPKDLKLKR